MTCRDLTSPNEQACSQWILNPIASGNKESGIKKRFLREKRYFGLKLKKYKKGIAQKCAIHSIK